MLREPEREGLRVAGLDEDGAGPRELADEALARRHAGNDAARSDALEHVLAVPRDQVAVVDDVTLVLLELLGAKSIKGSSGRRGVFWRLGGGKEGEEAKTYVLSDDGTERGDPEHALAGDLEDEHALAGEHRLAETLALVLLDDALSVCEEGVLADAPLLVAV